ncbi:efflux RND transporter periplasmic adaptor subunit [Daejeonella oryzae]|uniref:efflux RND transporter periplasmic adaptor subunit n=1 Tax=Daejeonella oryzae TaxID=1122943 RepID=UPI00068777B8|nr:efflux RND transporter periplasmic adaptor subunit [Daejeonella oryzae]
MKRILKGSFHVSFFLAVVMLLSCNLNNEKHAHEGEGTKYTCPMHPQIVGDEPGICPICKMDLVVVKADSGHAANDSLSMLVKPTDESILSSIKTVQPQKGNRFSESSVKGVINYNTNNWNSVSARVGGRIERLYVKYNYQAVNKGQKLMDIYSPDLVNAQQELLFLKNNNEPELMNAAKSKLRLLGFTQQQINRLIRTGKINYSVTIYSPYSGYVAEQQNSAASGGIPPSAGGTVISSSSADQAVSMGSMGSSANSGNPPPVPDVNQGTPLQLKEGQYISAGQKLFSLMNANQVWAEFYVTPEQIGEYKRGSIVKVQAIDNPAQNVKASVSLIQPYYNQGSNYSLVRATVPNPGKNWKVGQLISVGKELQGKPGIWLPRTAVLQLGTRYVSFIKKNGAFAAVYVEVRTINDDWVDVGNSLEKDEEVAENAWFLVDSESFIKVNRL